jgi:hypothetical protein
LYSFENISKIILKSWVEAPIARPVIVAGLRERMARNRARDSLEHGEGGRLCQILIMVTEFVSFAGDEIFDGLDIINRNRFEKGVRE